MKKLKIGFLQQHNTADVKDNIVRLADGIADLARRGAQLVVLQELHNSLYFCQVEDVDNFDLAEPIPGPSTELYSELAKRYGVVIVTSLFERRAAGLYHNTAVVIERDGTIAGKYRKMHIPDDPAYYEKFYFTPGDLGFHPIQTSVGSLGVLVCWDQWYPEAARLMAMQGAEVLIYPTAIGYESSDTPEEQERHREPRGPRTRPQRTDQRHSVLGHLLRCRPSRRNHLRSIGRRGREHHRGDGHGAVRTGTPLVAVPA